MSEYVDLLRPIKRSFKWGMFNFMDVNWKANIWSFTSLSLVASISFGTLFFFSLHVTDIQNNIESVAESGCASGSTFSLFAKLLTLLWKRKEIISFSDTIRRQYSKSLNEHPRITNVFASRFSLITKIFSGLIYSLPPIYVLTSLFGNGDAVLPLFIDIPYIPYRSKGWPFFHIAYFHQLAVMWVGVNLAISVDLLTFFYIQYVCCRIEILSRMVERWNENIKVSRGDFDDRKNSLLLKQIVKYHSSIKRNMNAIKRICSPMLMANLLTNSIVICMCMIIISLNPVMKMIFHISLGFSQTFMYCFIGNLLVKKNDNLVEKVMLVDYHYLKVRERKSYVTVVQNVCRPIQLQSFFVTVDMTLFFKVLKSAYSVFSLMKTRM